MTARTPPATPARTVTVRAATADDVDAGVDVLARAFAEDPGTVALLPDPARRMTLLRHAARQQLRRTVPHGSVHLATVDGEVTAVALWHAPGASSASLEVGARTLVDKLGDVSTYARSLPHVAVLLLRTTPQTLPLLLARRRAVRRASADRAWHLALLATAPEHQGRGLARQLLERQLERCDEDGLPAWLETTDPVNPPIYERFGFTVVGHVERTAWLPGLWVMRRDPAGAER